MDESLYNIARETLTSDKARYRLANLLAHSYNVLTVEEDSYVIVGTLKELFSDIIILPNGNSYTRCIG